MNPAPDDFSPQLAAVAFDHGVDVDRVLRESIVVLRQHGVRVGGAVQTIGEQRTACRRVMMVEDLLTGVILKISQDLGPEARSCILDPAALMEASAVLRLAMNNHVDVVVGNRFGEQEINGRGLRAELADAAAGGFIVLTTVQSRHVDGWIEFGGDYAVTLEPSVQTVSDWVFNAFRLRMQRHATSPACGSPSRFSTSVTSLASRSPAPAERSAASVAAPLMMMRPGLSQSAT